MNIKVYRIENQAQGHGIWRNFDGSWNPVFDKLSDGQVIMKNGLQARHQKKH